MASTQDQPPVHAGPPEWTKRTGDFCSAVDIFDAISDGVAVVDRDWHYVYVNEQLLRTTGKRKEELIGKVLWEVFPEAVGTSFEREGRRAMQERASGRLESRNPRLGRWFEVRFYPAASGLCFLTSDITERHAFEERLIASETRYRALFEAARDGILIVNSEGRYVDVNARYCEILKASRESLIGAHFSEFIPPERLEEAIAAFQRLEESGATPVNFPLRARDGSLVDLEWSSVSNYLPGLHFCLCRDVSERRRRQQERDTLLRELEEGRARLQAVADQMPCGLLIAEAPSGRLLFCNTEGERILGRTAANVDDADQYGRFGAVHEDESPYRPEEYPLTRVLRSGAEIRGEELGYVREDGTRTTLLVNCTPVRDAGGRIVAGVSVFTDIGDRKRMESELRESNAQLIKANRELEEFAFIASHDLREPLRMVDSYTQLLLRRFGSGDPDEEEFSGYIRTGVRRMEALIQDVLAYSRVLHAEPDAPESADLEEALDDALELLREQIAETGAVVEHGALPRVRGNRRELTQVFQNLISNAVKYRSREAAPWIRIEAAEGAGEWVVVVRDNGIGIQMKYAERIFRLFQRLHSTEYPGTGVGLAICKRVIERNGGRMWVESEEGAGSAFFFTLPAETR